MTLALPPYIYAKHDEADRKVTVTVGNPDIKHQKAMWGRYSRATRTEQS